MKQVFKSTIICILTWEAKILLLRFKPKIITITGNVGKTSTKDAIGLALSHFYKVRQSQKSFNSEIGLPLTILGLNNGYNNPLTWIFNIVIGFFKIFSFSFPEILVLEIGADRPGDIKKATSLVKPDITVLTKIGDKPVHIEYFADVDELMKEKIILAKALRDHGTLIVNGDDERALRAIDEVPGKKVLTFGLKETNDMRGSNYTIHYQNNFPVGFNFKIDYNGNSLPINRAGVLGKQHVYPILSAIAVLKVLNLNAESVIQNLSEMEPGRGRMRLLPGIKNTLIIDDSYNSAPSAMMAGLQTLKEIECSGKKIAVLGDMLDLGKMSKEIHLECGERASESANIIVTSGIRARSYAEGAMGNGFPENKVFQFDDSVKAGAMIQNLIEEGDIIFVKGSQGARMEKVVLEIMAEPDKAEKLLVRQERFWKGR